jgi:cytochrome c553
MLKRLIPAAVLATLWLSPAHAQEADLEEGRIVAFTCLGCHGIPFHTNVYPTFFVPRIKGQAEGYIRAALHAYRDGTRRHGTMQAQAHTLSDEDIRNVAAWFAGQGRDGS